MLALIMTYIIGSIPSGYVIARACGIADIRAHGSGNIGATNVARVLGARYFFIVFLCDFFKAYFCMLVLSFLHYSEYILLLAAFTLLMGNACSVFLRFGGGKGVVTLVGIICAFKPMLVIWSMCIFFPVLACTRTMGMASVATLISLPVLGWWLAVPINFFVWLCVVSLFGIFLHRRNIAQMWVTVK